MSELLFKFRSKKEIAPDVLLLSFERPDDFSFQAGQFVTFLIPGPDDKPLPRSYSICSSEDADTLDFAIKLVQNGTASTHLQTLHSGDTITGKGPFGKLVLNTANTNHTFIANGIGITPFIPMISKALSLGHTCTLHYGNKTVTDSAFNSELLNFESSHPDNFKYVRYISREDTKFNRGRITDYLPDIIHPDSQYYICGSGEMIKEVMAFLTGSGTDIGHIHREAFY